MPYHSPPGSVRVEVDCYLSQSALKYIVVAKILDNKDIVIWINWVITLTNIQNLLKLPLKLMAKLPDSKQRVLPFYKSLNLCKFCCKNCLDFSFFTLPHGVHWFIFLNISHIMIVKNNNYGMHCKGLLGNRESFWRTVSAPSKPF